MKKLYLIIPLVITISCFSQVTDWTRTNNVERLKNNSWVLDSSLTHWRDSSGVLVPVPSGKGIILNKFFVINSNGDTLAYMDSSGQAFFRAQTQNKYFGIYNFGASFLFNAKVNSRAASAAGVLEVDSVLGTTGNQAMGHMTQLVSSGTGKTYSQQFIPSAAGAYIKKDTVNGGFQGQDHTVFLDSSAVLAYYYDLSAHFPGQITNGAKITGDVAGVYIPTDTFTTASVGGTIYATKSDSYRPSRFKGNVLLVDTAATHGGQYGLKAVNGYLIIQGGASGTLIRDSSGNVNQAMIYSGGIRSYQKIIVAPNSATLFNVNTRGAVDVLDSASVEGDGIVGTTDTIVVNNISGDIAARNFSNTMTGHLYEAHYYLATTTPGTGTTASVSLTWNDGATKTFTSSNCALNAIDITGQVSGSQIIDVSSGIPQWSVSGTWGTSVAKLKIVLVRLY